MLEGKGTANDTSQILQAYLARREKGASFDILEKDSDIVAAFAWRTAHLTFEALKRGKRLDETRPGSGLGLSIVSELVALYGGQFALARSPFGGLRCVVRLPVA